MENKITNVFSKFSALFFNNSTKEQVKNKKNADNKEEKSYIKIKEKQIDVEKLTENQIEDILKQLHEEINKQTVDAKRRIERLIQIRHHNRQLQESKTMENYEKVKKQDIKLEDFSKEELVRIKILLEEELKLYSEKNAQEEKNNKILSQRIEKMYKKVKND